MQSCLYEGRLRHRRFSPTRNAFAYKLFMVYVDLSELETAFDCHPFWSHRGGSLACFTRADHLGDPKTPLHVSVRDLIENQTDTRPEGPIRLLTHFRYFGYRFNPVSFFYCYDLTGSLETIVAEINNTPWQEQHPYVLTPDQNRGSSAHHRYEFGKSFHVSPFMSMNQDYIWQFSTPGPSLSVHMDSLEQGEKCFDATLKMKRRELTTSALTRVLVKYPLMTTSVLASIYWQAARLWWKRTPVYEHPASIPRGT